MFNRAIDEGVLSDEYYPFKKNKYVIPASRNIKKALSLEEVKKIFEYETIPFTIEDFAKDLWIFSYLSNGMNMKDIALLKASSVNGEYLRLIRAKTERSTRNDLTTISVYLSEHARNIIYKWQGLSSEEDGFLFPILKRGMSAGKSEQLSSKQLSKSTNTFKKLRRNLESISP
jgi:hypothetical protein